MSEPVSEQAPAAPPIFAEITAESVRAALLAAVQDPTAMTHSWLFTGPPGSGRSVAAKIFATALVCPNGGCGACDSCRSAAAGSHPDILWVSTTGSVIPVQEVREVVLEAAKLPGVSDWRVVVVEDADRLNESGANALLKSVEEPPSHTVFLLCTPSTDPTDIAITLRSRCRHIYVPTPSRQEVEQVLLSDASLNLSAEQASWAAGVSGGHIGRARRLAQDETSRKKRATALKLPQLVYEPGAVYRFTAELVTQATAEAASSLEARDEREMAELEASLGMGSKGKGVAKAQRGSAGQINALEKEQGARRKRMMRDSLDLALIDVAGLYRDAMMLAAGAVDEEGAPVGGFQHPDMAATSKELARRNSPEAMVRCIDAVAECRETLKLNVRPEVALDAMAGRLRECCAVV
ncbi:DNA polymerase III subunit delta' [Corynebacterium suicordis]|nr:DNA polymerase III subunit delta' [Corynebacterium suicordis]MDR6278322.1 DNA polymerase-3 subunit delta' [Corynebacterium suicordis]